VAAFLTYEVPYMLLESGGAKGEIKWFKENFGFIGSISGGPDVFLHKGVVEAAGIPLSGLHEGRPVWYEVGPDPRGNGKVCCIAIRLRDAEAPKKKPKADKRPAVQGAECESLQLKFYNVAQGFGFFIRPGHRDVFVNKSVIELSGVGPLIEGNWYEVTFALDKGGHKATKIELAQR
jgi:cold shock CspA family protein